ncbi:Cyclin, N-terminal domain containing protein [Tritrichomonas foetus]|uniref:Cyclin, N-terminal domain containing protein n=1 Tax=Tritrichomonas foetus TaxID=1144522 RepID=A0A1J4L1N8_9EUKA|nr:Cyclin, N-terminal domain containing protein [Tritrichomonas foetus]|eukprot:OHT15884.1 Cyclin, N-terminal domain containing protein [Tritrichomonas foetus]
MQEMTETDSYSDNFNEVSNELPILRVIAFILQEASKEGSLLTGPNLNLTRFHTLSPPKMSILSYLEYLKEKSHCSITCFVVSLIYLDHLIAGNVNIQITPNTVHKLFLAALVTTVKFHTDICLNNSAWSIIGGIRVEELDILENEFLFLLKFSLVISKEEFNKYNRELKLKSALPPFSKTFI